MNENSKGNSNMNPEQARLSALFQERERLTWEAAHGRLEQLPPRKMDNKTRAAALRKLLDRMYPDKSDAYKLERLREIWGTAKKPAKKTAPVPVKKTAPQQARKSAPAKKTEERQPANISAIWDSVNRRIAAHYGIKEPGEIIYR